MFQKDKTETSPVAKTMGSAARVIAAGIGGEAAVGAVSAMGRLFKLLGVGRVKPPKQSSPEAALVRGAKIDDLRDE